MATIRDVAERAGLSVGTVSRILNGSGYASAEARRRVNAAVAELDYTPNSYARSLHSSRSKLLDIVLQNVEMPFFTRLLQAVQGVCLERDYKLTVRSVGRDPEEERSFYKSLAALRTEGILLCGDSPAMRVYLQGELPLLRVGQGPGPVVCRVNSDDCLGGTLAARELLDSGCRRPAVFNFLPPEGDSQETPRLTGFREECRRRNVTPVLLDIPDGFLDSLTACRRRLGAMLADHPEVDGLFTMMDGAAIAAVLALQQMGRRVPEDVKVVGYDGTDARDYTGVTTLAQPLEELGRTAVELLLRHLAGEAIPGSVLLPVRLVPRESTRG